jgi:hypothetical protein
MVDFNRARRGGRFGKKKGNFVRVGSMFKDKPEYLHENAKYGYSTTCSGEYLAPVAELIAKAAEEGSGVRFNLKLWKDSKDGNPVLTISPVDSKPGKRITKAKEDAGLQDGEEIN